MKERTPNRKHLELGAYGERLAAKCYKQNGWTILDKNWRRREGEIDLIADKGEILVFCEVKTRSSKKFGSPAEAVNEDKQKRLRKLALLWLSEVKNYRCKQIRFDVAEVMGKKVVVHENAF